MLSAASTVTEFCTPDTERLAQWPVITTVLETPLTLTALSLQAIVRFSLMPEMVRSVPAGGVGTAADDVDGAAPGVWVTPPDGLGLLGKMLGVGHRVAKPLRETWCAVKSKIPAGRAIMPMTKTAATIHHVRLRENSPEDVLEYELL